MKTNYVHSFVAIAPASSRAAANDLAEGLGWGPNNFSVPLSATGEEPPTHYGLVTNVTPSFLGLLDGATGAEKTVADLLAFDTEPAGKRAPLEHFKALLGAQGLAVIEPDEPDEYGAG